MGNWGGLSHDDHTGYALLAGRSGGQTIQGGTASGDDLTFLPTSNEFIGSGEFHFNGGYLCTRFNADGKPRPSGLSGDGGLSVSWNYVGGSRSVDFWNTDTANTSDTSFTFRQLTGATHVDLVNISATGKITGVAGLTLSGGPIKRALLSKTADYVVSDTDTDIIITGALSAHATITLPTAADNTGRIITVIIDGDPGAFNVIVDGEGDERINGATTKTNSDQYSFIKVLCNGTGWNIVGSSGTWT